MSMHTLQRTAAYAGLARDALRLRTAGNEAVEQRARDHLSQRMGRLKGLPQKLGQMLSFTNDDSKQVVSTAYASLQESAEPLPWEMIAAQLADAWKCAPETNISWVDPSGHAASLGQVHRAILHDGREVAIKVQYPGIQAAVETDLKALGWLSLPVGNLRRGFDLQAYRQVFRSGLDEELDYRQEAMYQSAFRQQFRGNDAVVIPQVVSSLSSHNVLVSSWEEGDHWETVHSTWSFQERQQLAALLLQVFLKGLFSHGMLQADWHPGNLRFRRTTTGVQVVMYDLGCVCRLSRNQRLLLARLIDSTIRGSESPWPLMTALGFNAEYLEPLEAKLPAVCRMLFEPFCAPHPYDMNDWNLGERMSAVLDEDRWNFRIAGPPELIFLMRAFHGLSFYLKGLQVSAHWQKPFRAVIEPLLDDMQSVPLPETRSHTCFESLSQHLKIRVTQNGQTKVKLTQPAANIERLDQLLDDPLRQRIAGKGIEVRDIVDEVRQRAYRPGPVFELSEGDRQIEIWLE